jgi:hypothetical protein
MPKKGKAEFTSAVKPFYDKISHGICFAFAKEMREHILAAENLVEWLRRKKFSRHKINLSKV